MDNTVNLSAIKNIAVLGNGKTANAVISKLAQLSAFNITNDTKKADLVIISPGLVPAEHIQGITCPVISEIEFAFLLFIFYKKVPKLITITGTNGKTTTTDLISQLLDIPVAGNIGKPLIDFVSENTKEIPDIIALEVSSYQLETCYSFKPDIYILLNITEDHLVRHKTMEEYARMKLKTLEKLTNKEYFIYNSNDNITKEYIENKKIQASLIDLQNTNNITDLLKASPLLGEHNKENLSAAINAILLVNKEKLSINKIKRLKSYPHRLEFIGNVEGITFINDSKATNPASTIAALNAVNKTETILLLGGEKKEVSHDKMFKIINDANIRIVAFGKARTFFSNNLKELLIGESEDLESAVKLAFTKSNKGDTILLSPACASFDMYNNFEERGNDFKRSVSEISNN